MEAEFSHAQSSLENSVYYQLIILLSDNYMADSGLHMNSISGLSHIGYKAGDVTIISHLSGLTAELKSLSCSQSSETDIKAQSLH